MLLKILLGIVVLVILTELYIGLRFIRPISMFSTKKKFLYPWERAQTPYISMCITPILMLKIWFSHKNRIRLFAKSLHILFESLEKGEVYEAVTHEVILKKIQLLKKKGNIRIVRNYKRQDENLFFEKLLLFNFKELIKKKPSYYIVFEILNPLIK
ncbi:MAG: hypothetical protein H6Q67_1656 [Firmicutes bacterium]|nr:hypothetical protein [Bacillota bacterium]